MIELDSQKFHGFSFPLAYRNYAHTCKVRVLTIYILLETGSLLSARIYAERISSDTRQKSPLPNAPQNTHGKNLHGKNLGLGKNSVRAKC